MLFTIRFYIFKDYSLLLLSYDQNSNVLVDSMFNRSVLIKSTYRYIISVSILKEEEEKQKMLVNDDLYLIIVTVILATTVLSKVNR